MKNMICGDYESSHIHFGVVKIALTYFTRAKAERGAPRVGGGLSALSGTGVLEVLRQHQRQRLGSHSSLRGGVFS